MLTGWTVVSTEVEFDDAERDAHLALREYQRGVGPCGFHHSLTSDLNNHFTFERPKCILCAESARFGRVVESAHEAERMELKSRHGGRLPAHVPHPGDGERIFARPMSPAEVEALQDATPVRA